MNWITRNNYTIKRKFNQFNVNKNKNKKNEEDINNKKEEQNIFNNNNNKNQINYNINKFNQDNDKNSYTNIYYQINGNENLEDQLKKGENIIQNNLNCKYILSNLSEF